jgi:hypothetical protein
MRHTCWLAGAWLTLDLVMGIDVAGARELAPSTLIEWEAPQGCPDVDTVYERLSAVLGGAPSDLGVFSRVRGGIVEAPPAWQLTLVMFDGKQSRSRLISAPRCADLAEAAALAIALALDAEAGRSEAVPAASLAGPDDAPGEPRAPTPALGQDLHVEAELGGVLDLSSLPSPAAGATLLGRLRWGATSLGLQATLLPSETESVRSDRFVQFGLMAMAARVCQRAFEGVLHGAACLGFEAGQLQAEGSGLIDAQRVHGLWLAPSAALELGIPVWGRLGLALRAEAARPLVRPLYVINDTESVYRTPIVSSRVYLSAVWALK